MLLNINFHIQMHKACRSQKNEHAIFFDDDDRSSVKNEHLGKKELLIHFLTRYVAKHGATHQVFNIDTYITYF